MKVWSRRSRASDTRRPVWLHEAGAGVSKKCRIGLLHACSGFAGECSEADVVSPGVAVQLRGSCEPAGRVLRGAVGPYGVRGGDIRVSGRPHDVVLTWDLSGVTLCEVGRVFAIQSTPSG